MILIFSEEDEKTTQKVCDWLKFYNVPFTQIVFIRRKI